MSRRRAMTGADLQERPLGLIARVRAAIRRAVITALWSLGIFTAGCISLIFLVTWLANRSQPTFPSPPAALAATPTLTEPPRVEPPRQSFLPQSRLDNPPAQVEQVNHEVVQEAAKPVVAAAPAPSGGSSLVIRNDEPEPNEDTHIWIKSYTKLDGTFVQGHWRKKTEAETRPKKTTPAHVAEAMPERDEPSYSGSSGSGGTVYVKGYTKKNGTYVAPHTRSAPRRK